MLFNLFGYRINITKLAPQRYRVITLIRENGQGPHSEWFVKKDEALRFAQGITLEDVAFIEQHQDFESFSEVWDTWKQKRILRVEISTQEEIIQHRIKVTITK